jgi:hypothetical protein
MDPFPPEFYSHGFKDFYPKANSIALKSRLMRSMFKKKFFKSHYKHILTSYFENVQYPTPKQALETKLTVSDPSSHGNRVLDNNKNNLESKKIGLYQYFFQEYFKHNPDKEKTFAAYKKFYFSQPLIHSSKFKYEKSFSHFKSAKKRQSYHGSRHEKEDSVLGRDNYTYFGFGFLGQLFNQDTKAIYIYEPDCFLRLGQNVYTQGFDAGLFNFKVDRLSLKNQDSITYLNMVDETMEFDDFIDIISLYSTLEINFIPNLQQCLMSTSETETITEVIIDKDLPIEKAKFILNPNTLSTTDSCLKFMEQIKSSERIIDIPFILIKALSEDWTAIDIPEHLDYREYRNFDSLTRPGVSLGEDEWLEETIQDFTSGLNFLNYDIYGNLESINDKFVRLTELVLQHPKFENLCFYANNACLLD